MTRSLHLMLLTALLAGQAIAQDNITLAVGYGGRRMITAKRDLLVSPDGSTWEQISPKKGVPSSIYYDPSAKTYFGFSWRSRLWTSEDGLSWERNEDSGKNAITGIVSSVSLSKQ